MLATLLLAGALVALSLVLLVIHWRAHQWAATAELEVAERNFLGRQFRRRMQVNAMLGILGIALAIGQLVTGPTLVGIYWIAVLGLIAWIVLLALGDYFASQAHYLRISHQLEAERAILKAELARAQGHEGNGHSGR